MNSLFAPWRMEFIEGKAKAECVFCTISQSQEKEQDEKFQVLSRAKTSYVVMNKFPYSNGHLLVIPYRHENDWTKLSAQENADLSELTQKSLIALKASLKPEGFNLGTNLGKAAGAGIEQHVHQHIVPRWLGDTNFMPLLGETKVISEHLQRTFERIREAWPK